MKLDEFRSEMQAYWQSINDEAKALKDSDLVSERLHNLYVKLDPNERHLADEVIAEWALSDVEAKRFDALALIDDFKIASAAPTLRKLADRLVANATPSAAYELKKVKRIIAGLG